MARTTSRPLRVDAIVAETDEIKRFCLSSWDGAELPAFSAGSHVDIFLTDKLVRQYSLLNSPDNRRHYEIAVKREPESRGGSIAMHDQVSLGSTLHVGTPRNNFELRPSAHSVLIGGGIGITPLLCMARSLASEGRSFALHYFARSADHVGFAADLEEIGRYGGVHAHVAKDVTESLRLIDEIVGVQPAGAHIYACGPGPMMQAVATSAREHLQGLKVFTEDFGRIPAGASADDEPFEIVLQSSGLRFAVASDKTILDVLLENGADVCSSCEQGFCGTCITNVVEGIPDHRDDFLSEREKAENRAIALCVSRSKTPVLVLDL